MLKENETNFFLFHVYICIHHVYASVCLTVFLCRFNVLQKLGFSLYLYISLLNLNAITGYVRLG